MKLLLRFVRPYWKLCLLTILVLIVDVVGALLIPTMTADIVNVGISNGDMGVIVQRGLIMLGVSILSSLGALLGSWLCAKLSSKIGEDMRNAVYDKSLKFSASDFEKFGTGSMITRTLSDITVIQQAFVSCIQMVLPVPIMCIAGIVFAFQINQNAGFLILGIIAIVLIVAIIVVKKSSKTFEKMQKLLDRMNVVLREDITGVRVIRAFNKENYEEKRMKKTFTNYADSAIKVNRLFAFLDSWAMLIINICVVAILWLGGNTVAGHAMEIGDITALTEYAILILFYIIMAQMVIILMPRANVCLKRMKEVLSHNPEIVDGEEVKNEVEVTKSDDIIRFDNVSFRFGDADENTLDNLNFTCRRGETTAIIGGTGNGKSTIVKLILRFHDVTQGGVYLKDCDVRKMSQKSLRDSVAYVPQKAWLFSGTIESNLRYGNENATEEDMQKALKIAQADFVNNLQDGLKSHVAQGGTNFSGGQKQRLSIARALMKRADLYIFDDSFSALDFKTDAKLRKALKEETKDSAVLIIAQRINTILHADQIIVLDNGKIAGIGRHEELMKTCAVYQDIAKSQLRGGDTRGE